MTPDSNPTRRRILRNGAALGAASLGLAATGTVAAKPGNGRQFGRVYANDDLWRTNVVRVLEERPDPEDRIYFLHDGEQPVVARDDVNPAQASPFISESAPGDRDWNGGQWTHFSAEVTDVDAFNEHAPVSSATEVLAADYVEITLGRPEFGPPDFFICPLNGRA